MKEGQGIREYTDVGQEGPNQSNNTSGRCSIFNAEFSRGLSLGRDSRARQAHTVTIAGRHRQWTCSSKNISKKHRYNSQEPIWVRLHCWVNKRECRCVLAKNEMTIHHTDRWLQRLEIPQKRLPDIQIVQLGHSFLGQDRQRVKRHTGTVINNFIRPPVTKTRKHKYVRSLSKLCKYKNCIAIYKANYWIGAGTVMLKVRN